MNEQTQRIVNILAPLVEQFREPPAGASDSDLAAIRRMFGIGMLPTTVEAYLRAVGADGDVCGELYAGVETFDLSNILESGPAFLERAREMGAPAEELRAAIPYTSTAEFLGWLAWDQSSPNPGDARFWAVLEDGEVAAGDMFADDLAFRVEYAIERLAELRRDVDGGLMSPVDQVAEWLGDPSLVAKANELAAEQFGEELMSQIEEHRQVVNRRKTALRRRLRD